MNEKILNLLNDKEFTTKQELMELTGHNDRTVRQCVSDLKLKHTIISSSNHKGYRKAREITGMNDEEKKFELLEIIHCINQINSKKKIYNKQLRQYIAYKKVLEREMQ